MYQTAGKTTTVRRTAIPDSSVSWHHEGPENPRTIRALSSQEEGFKRAINYRSTTLMPRYTSLSDGIFSYTYICVHPHIYV